MCIVKQPTITEAVRWLRNLSTEIKELDRDPADEIAWIEIDADIYGPVIDRVLSAIDDGD